MAVWLPVLQDHLVEDHLYMYELDMCDLPTPRTPSETEIETRILIFPPFLIYSWRVSTLPARPPVGPHGTRRPPQIAAPWTVFRHYACRPAPVATVPSDEMPALRRVHRWPQIGLTT